MGKRASILRYRYITYSMVQSPSWAANWFAASQEIPRISQNPNVHYCTHKHPPLSYICSCLLTFLFIFYLSLLHIHIHYFICVLTGNINHIDIRFPILPDSLTVVFSAALRSLCTGDVTLLKSVQILFSIRTYQFRIRPTTILDLRFHLFYP